jgi:hypothetical protein
MDTQNSNRSNNINNANNTRPQGLGDRPALRAANAAPTPAARANNRNQTISRVKRLVAVASLASVLLGGGVMVELDLAKQQSLLDVQATSQPLYDPQDASTADDSATSVTLPIIAQAQDTATATATDVPVAQATDTTTPSDVAVAQAPATATEVPATATDVPVAAATSTPTQAAVAKAIATPVVKAATSNTKAPVARTRSSQ